jgi:beta-glucanase (GH16 family)
MALKCLSVALAASAASARFIFDRSLNDTVGFRNDTISIQENAPGYGGFNLIWQETFPGAAGQLPNEGNWNIITNLHVNNEWQDYTRSSQNMQMSGGATLQIVPRKDASGKWTSGRLESKYVFTPADGRVTRAEARIRFGSAVPPNSAGLWPAFWMLGNSIRNGVSWPACGEIDIMERVRGEFTGYGTIHCDVYPGGACNEPTGRGGAIGIPDQGWHT